MTLRLGLGVLFALAIFLADAALVRAVVMPDGIRAQAIGACLATLAMVAGGFFLGVVHRRRTGGPTVTTPHLGAIASAMVLALLSALFLYLPILGATPLPGSLAHALLSTNAIALPALVLIELGAAIGVHAKPGWIKGTAGGWLALLVLQVAGSEGAVRASWDPAVVEGLIIASTLISFLIAGALIAALVRRLGFIELLLTALGWGYALYLGVGLWGGELFKKATIPEQQILVSLSLVPTITALGLLTVGASIGFLLFGGGKLDPSFGYELMVALRYLKVAARRSTAVVAILLVAALAMLSRSLILSIVLVGPLILVLLLLRRALTDQASYGGTRRGFVGVTLWISVIGVCLGVMALIVVLSVMGGFEDDLRTKILGAHAHIAIHKKGDDFVEYAEYEEKVRKVDGVVTAAAFVLGEGMISSEAGLSGTLVKGIDPKHPDAVAELQKNIEKGRLEHLLDPEKIPGSRKSLRLGSDTSTTGLEYPPPRFDGQDVGSAGDTGRRKPADDLGAPLISGDLSGSKRTLPGIVIGREMAKTLRVYVGDVVNLVSPVSEEIGPTGPQPKLRRFRVAAIFYSGMYEFDSKFSYLEMQQAQRFFGMRGKATGIELRVADLDDTPWIVEEVKRRVGGHPFGVKDWREMNKELFSALLLEKLAMFIILTFIVMVASFLIVSTLVMIVLEKGREIAILKSMGSSDASIMKVFVAQGLIVGFGGATLGLIGGLGICLIIQRFGIPLDPDVFYITRLPVVISWAEVAVIVSSAMIITYLASIYPAVAAAQLSPVEGLRDE